MPDWGQILKYATAAAAPAIGYLGARHARHEAEDATAGSRLQDILPLIQSRLPQLEQAAQQNYALQQRRSLLTDPGAAGMMPGASVPEGARPLGAALSQMAFGLLPNRYTAGLSIPQPGPATPLPTPSSAPSQDTRPIDLLQGYSRRGGGGDGSALGGAASGAATGAGLGSVVPGVGTAIGAGAGALIGGLGGLFNKHAETAPTDFTTNDAHEIINNAFLTYYGRPGTPEEIEGAMRGQGWAPDHRFLGEAPVLYIVEQIRNNALANQGNG